MNTLGFTYLAAPYSHHDPKVREERYKKITEAAADLMRRGSPVFSPITHSHHLGDLLPANLRNSHEFWMAMDLPILEKAAEVFVLVLPGWDTSRGVALEIEHAKSCGIPVWYWWPGLGGCNYPPGTLPGDVRRAS